MSDRIRRASRIGAAVVATVGAGGALAASSTAGRAQSTVGFTPPVFVDQAKAGGEPLIMASTKYGTLVYSSHEGTTHLDRAGLAGTQSFADFLCPGVAVPADCPYPNHVWIWTSTDHGKTWQARDEGRLFTGFSDPDLTIDESGAIYDTGIDLVNNAVFSSRDGGITWPTGTTNCNEGDRPWLAGGKAGEVFMSTDLQTAARHHTIFHSSNYAASCDGNGLDSNGINDDGTLPDGTRWSGFGKGLYDHFDGSYLEPAIFTHADGSQGVGYSRLANASSAFPAATATFTPVEVMKNTSVYSPFGAPNVLSMDSNENLYFAWDTNDRAPNTTGGCSAIPNQSGGATGGTTPVPNRIMFAAGTHDGPGHWTFSTPISLAHQGNAWVQWPWSVAGNNGNVSVVWYQTDTLMDPDCDGINGTSLPDVKTYIYEAHITNAIDPAARQITVTNASGRFVHQGGICNSGTTCAATGQDRRLGDYFTNAIDANGCVIIASGDTTVLDSLTGQPRLTSLPIFISQNSGPSLTGKDCATTAATTGGTTGSSGASGGSAGLTNTAAFAVHGSAVSLAALLAGAGTVVAGTARRRRRRARR